MKLLPYLKVVGHASGSATISAEITFDKFDDAMEFNQVLVDFLMEKLNTLVNPEVFDLAAPHITEADE